MDKTVVRRGVEEDAPLVGRVWNDAIRTFIVCNFSWPSVLKEIPLIIEISKLFQNSYYFEKF